MRKRDAMLWQIASWATLALAVVGFAMLATAPARALWAIVSAPFRSPGTQWDDRRALWAVATLDVLGPTTKQPKSVTVQR